MNIWDGCKLFYVFFIIGLLQPILKSDAVENITLLLNVCTFTTFGFNMIFKVFLYKFFD